MKECDCFSYNLSKYDGTEIDNRIIMEIKGKPIGIDKCISDLIKSLNESGITTEASCCGHNKMPGIISLSDGRELSVFKSREHYKEYMPHFVKSLNIESWSKKELLEYIEALSKQISNMINRKH